MAMVKLLQFHLVVISGGNNILKTKRRIFFSFKVELLIKFDSVEDLGFLYFGHVSLFDHVFKKQVYRRTTGVLCVLFGFGSSEEGKPHLRWDQQRSGWLKAWDITQLQVFGSLGMHT
jgi:hypothetical protein